MANSSAEEDPSKKVPQGKNVSPKASVSFFVTPTTTTTSSACNVTAEFKTQVVSGPENNATVSVGSGADVTFVDVSPSSKVCAKCGKSVLAYDVTDEQNGKGYCSSDCFMAR